jgi:hypothetical protein
MIKLAVSGDSTIRKLLTAMLALAILLWAEAGLALIAGERVMACHATLLHGQAETMAAEDASDTQDSDAMPCCPAPGKGPVVAVDHPPCCSVSNAAERPVAFLVISERTTHHPVDAVTVAAGGILPSPAYFSCELRSADAPCFVKPVLELKTDLRI